MIREHVATQPKSLVLMLSGLLLAVFVNFFPAPFIYSNQLFFGNAIAIAFAVLYGPRFALITSLAASTVTYIYWQHALGFIPFALEVLVVVFALHIKRSILISGLLFWLSLGPIVVFALYYLFSDFSATGIETITLKYILNGIMNILLGYILFHLVRVLKLEQSVRYRITTSELLLNSGFFIALSISTLIIYFWLLAVNKELYSQLETRALNFSNAIQQTTDNHIEKHILAIRTLANTITETAAIEYHHNLLQNTGRLYPAYITMLATDANGELIATWPSDMLARAQESGITNVRGRDYFQVAKESGSAFVSNAFRGQGFGNDPIVAISAPYYLHDQFAGVIEGSLNLAELHEFLLPDTQHDANYIIADGSGSVIYASPELQLSPLQELGQTLSNYTYSNQPTPVVYAPTGNEYVTYQVRLPRSGWSITALIPMGEYEQKLSNYLFGSFALLLILSILFGTITYLIARILTKPIGVLINHINTAKSNNDIIPLEKQEIGYLKELNDLTSGYHDFTVNLNKTMRSLKRSNVLNEELNNRLQILNTSLEKRVLQRTEQLELALESVKAANEMKSSFMANMSHEIRTPLHGILGMTEVLLHQQHPEDVQQQLQIIQQSGQHLQVILNDILDFSKLEAGKLSIHRKPINIASFIHRLADSYQANASKKGLALNTYLDNNLPSMLLIDEVRVRQILGNLISNAIKFTDKGSANIQVSYANNTLTIAIIDSGIGISESDMKRLYQPFQQLDDSGARRYEGTGLGLAISMQLAQLMGATLECKSTVGSGTTFTLALKVKAV
ncbi:MAG: hypothetical protein LAT53_09930 [Idiomarina sp.]|nr:hypothetical protein [Idiomarina sp.]